MNARTNSSFARPSMPTDAIKGRVVLITGGDGGIGCSLADAFERAGAARVISVSRRSERRSTKTRWWRPVDVTDPEAVDVLAAEVGDQIDILVNNAGVNTGCRLFEATLDDFRNEMDVNYFGPLNLVRAFAPALRRRDGATIVNMLSVVAHVNLPLMAGYSASKAAALSLTQALRAELSRDAVRVCAVFPAVVDTDMSRNIPPPKMSPQELADAVIAAIQNDDEDVYPGFASQVINNFRADAKAVEHMMASRLPV